MAQSTFTFVPCLQQADHDAVHRRVCVRRHQYARAAQRSVRWHLLQLRGAETSVVSYVHRTRQGRLMGKSCQTTSGGPAIYLLAEEADERHQQRALAAAEGAMNEHHGIGCLCTHMLSPLWLEQKFTNRAFNCAGRWAGSQHGAAQQT